MRILFSVWCIFMILSLDASHEVTGKSSEQKKKEKGEGRGEKAKSSGKKGQNNAEENKPSYQKPDLVPMSPKVEGYLRNTTVKTPPGGLPPLTEQVLVPAGTFWFGSQMVTKDGKLAAIDANGKLKDGADPRKKVVVKNPFWVDIDCVTNEQFEAFITATNYHTEAELFGWSFVFDSLSSEQMRRAVDGKDPLPGDPNWPKQGLGRVKGSEHWMGVGGADWLHPFGPDSSIYDSPSVNGDSSSGGGDLLQYPVVHVSYSDAVEYCHWASNGLCDLPAEKQWEYAARGNKVNQSFPWGNSENQLHKRLNIWEGSDFPKSNPRTDGHEGPGPVLSYWPNDYGLFNMVGNVWEWVRGGKKDTRLLRGGSFLDSLNGEFNHAVRVSSRQVNAGDSAASNIGFRCSCKGSVSMGAAEDDTEESNVDDNDGGGNNDGGKSEKSSSSEEDEEQERQGEGGEEEPRRRRTVWEEEEL